ncbi:MAG: hypothetical protein SFW67_36775 [Myxococcaceae bacterium]|nr:hypothetical protein [Myxococcaceae bacterium]
MLTWVALSAEPKERPVLALACPEGAPHTVDLLASVGKGSNALVRMWSVSTDRATSSIVRRRIDPHSAAFSTTAQRLSPAAWDDEVRQLDFPEDPPEEALAAWRELPVRVVWKKKCRNRPEERLELSISRVETRANVRLLAAALLIIDAAGPYPR